MPPASASPRRCLQSPRTTRCKNCASAHFAQAAAESGKGTIVAGAVGPTGEGAGFIDDDKAAEIADAFRTQLKALASRSASACHSLLVSPDTPRPPRLPSLPARDAQENQSRRGGGGGAGGRRGGHRGARDVPVPRRDAHRHRRACVRGGESDRYRKKCLKGGGGAGREGKEEGGKEGVFRCASWCCRRAGPAPFRRPCAEGGAAAAADPGAHPTLVTAKQQ